MSRLTEKDTNSLKYRLDMSDMFATIGGEVYEKLRLLEDIEDELGINERGVREMKSIIISIKPKYVAEILNHRKTLEIRKTAPKCELPCEVYIYCTKDKNELRLFDKEICEQFKCNRARVYSLEQQKYYTALIGRKSIPCNGKVVAKFTLDKVEEIERNQFSIHWTKTLKGTDLCEMSCLTPTQLSDYLRLKKGYAWHIDHLVPFDRPKELKEFGVKRSPQSWQFIEVDE